MEVLFDSDEFYPVYIPVRKSETNLFDWPAKFKAVMTEEEYADFVDVYDRFVAWQDILQDRVEVI